MTRKATPAQDSFPVRSHTTKAMMAAGRKKNKTFAINTMMMNPMNKRNKSKIHSKDKGKDMHAPLQSYQLDSMKLKVSILNIKGREERRS